MHENTHQTMKEDSDLREKEIHDAKLNEHEINM